MPKPGLLTASTNSASFSIAATPLSDKKTRYQPNLTDCHCRARRVNNTNTKDRLLLLDNIWRIVLLCRKYRRNVRSRETCPYCFQRTGNSSDFIMCSICERKIHINCVRIYGNSTHWRYLGVDSEWCRVCVDLWVSELLKNSIRVCWRSKNARGSKEKGEDKDLMKNAVKSRGKETKNDALYFLLGSKAENSNLDDPIDAQRKALNSSPRMLTGMQFHKWDKARKIRHSAEENTLASESGLSIPKASVYTNDDQNNVNRF